MRRSGTATCQDARPGQGWPSEALSGQGRGVDMAGQALARRMAP
jgi:hypothetical protein